MARGVTVPFTADGKAFKKGLDTMRKQAGSFAKGIGGMFKDALSTAGGIAIFKGFSKGLSLITDMGKRAVRGAADIETLEIAYPYLFRYLNLFPMQENGLPEYRKRKSPDTWDWLDWGVKDTIDKQPIQMAFYYLAIREAKQMAEVFGNEDHIEWYDTRMADEDYDKKGTLIKWNPCLIIKFIYKNS